MSRIFLFGTLLDAGLRATVFGTDVDGVPASLPGHAVETVRDGDWPILIERPGAAAEGLWVEIDPRQLDRVDFYEAGFACLRREVTVETEAGAFGGSVYRGPDGTGSGTAWSLSDWQADRGPMTRIAAIEVMSMHGEIDTAALRARMPTIRSRADAAVRAAAFPKPHQRRASLRRDDVSVLSHRQPYAHYFALAETRLRHPLFGGGQSDVVERAGFVMGDAVTVLPYDPVRDRVMLVEQFRYGPWLRGDPFPWALEPIAGRIDPGEDAPTTARRESEEEAGLTLRDLHEIARYYASPGAVTEYIISFVGVTDLPDGTGGLGGLDAEHEDIRSHVMSFDDAMALTTSGEVDTGPTLVSLLWLQRERAAGRFA